MFLSSSKEHPLFSLKEGEMLGDTETQQKCVEKKLQTIVMVSKVDTGNKAVRNLTSAKGLIPLQSKIAQYANVFRLDKKAKEEDLPRTFEDHVKFFEESVAFLSNHEQEALESTGKRHTNGPDITIPRCTRQSFLIVPESLASLTNTLTEIGHSHLLDRIFFESMTTLGVECYFKGMRADHDMPTVANYAYRRARCVEDDMLRIHQKDFSYQSLGPIHFIRRELSKVKPRTSRRDQTSCQQSLKEQVAKKKIKARNCDARICWGVWKRRKTGKCPLKNERVNWHPSLCP